MFILVGLGNPGSDYAGNRHNVGFMAVDAIHRCHDFAPFRSKFEGHLAEGTIGPERVLLLKPATFMNESGRSVGAALRFFKIPTADMTVFHDELDLAPGKLRVKTGGGIAGHNGLRSIVDQRGPEFRRVRIGIGHPGDKDRVTGHVLRDFSKDEEDWVVRTTEAMAEAAPLLLAGDDAGFASRVALILKPERPAKPAPGPEGDGG
jgi:PTH1 family peptidyl-tRNA hydrolase